MRNLVQEDRELMQKRCVATLQQLYDRVDVPDRNELKLMIRRATDLPGDTIPFIEGIPLGIASPFGPMPLEFVFRIATAEEWDKLTDKFQVTDSVDDGLFLLLRNEYADLFRKQIIAGKN